MANADRPSGFRPIGTKSGAPWYGHVRRYPVAAATNDTSAICLGTMCSLAADGTVMAAVSASNVDLLGACVGIEHSNPGDNTGRSLQGGGSNDLNLSNKALDQDLAGHVLIAVGTDVLYEVQEVSGGTALALTDIGLNADFTSEAQTDLTKRSTMELNNATEATTAASVRIVDLVRREDNAVGEHAKWVVCINEGHFNKLTGV